MYNGIGLTTPRGSGTNGHVQRNWAFVRAGKQDNSNYRAEEDIKRLDAQINRPPNKEILDHDRKRKIEVKCLEFEEVLEKQGYSVAEIKQKVDAYRNKSLAQAEKDTLPKDEFGRITVRETHQIAAAQQHKNAKLREAFNISEYFVEGSSFDSDRYAKEDIAKGMALQKELDAQKDLLSGNASCTVASSSKADKNAVSRADAERELKSEKKKKKKRQRSRSTSSERKAEKRKKSKKQKKESGSKKKKSKKQKRNSSPHDESSDGVTGSPESTSSLDSSEAIKKPLKKSKKNKKQRNKKKSKESLKKLLKSAEKENKKHNETRKNEETERCAHKTKLNGNEKSETAEANRHRRVSHTPDRRTRRSSSGNDRSRSNVRSYKRSHSRTPERQFKRARSNERSVPRKRSYGENRQESRTKIVKSPTRNRLHDRHARSRSRSYDRSSTHSPVNSLNRQRSRSPLTRRSPLISSRSRDRLRDRNNSKDKISNEHKKVDKKNLKNNDDGKYIKRQDNLTIAPVRTMCIQAQSENDSDDGVPMKSDKPQKQNVLHDVLDEFQNTKHGRADLKDFSLLQQLKSDLSAKAKEKVKTMLKLASEAHNQKKSPKNHILSDGSPTHLVSALANSTLVDEIVSKVSTATVAAAESAARRSRSRSRVSRRHSRSRSRSINNENGRSSRSYSRSSQSSSSSSSHTNSRSRSRSRSRDTHSTRSRGRSSHSSSGSISSTSHTHSVSRSPSIPRRRGSPSFLDRRRITRYSPSSRNIKDIKRSHNRR